MNDSLIILAAGLSSRMKKSKSSNILSDTILNQANNVEKGLIVTGVTTSTTFSGSGASLTNLPAAQITGSLPAIDGSNLTGLASREFYGFKAVNEDLVLIHTNSGADNISLSDFESFEDTMTAPSGLSFAINSAGELEMTI